MQEFIMQNQTAILLLALWILPWKGYALWIAARKNDPWWFVAILVVNTLAILDILYIFFFSKWKKQMSLPQTLPSPLPPPEHIHLEKRV